MCVYIYIVVIISLLIVFVWIKNSFLPLHLFFFVFAMYIWYLKEKSDCSVLLAGVCTYYNAATRWKGVLLLLLLLQRQPIVLMNSVRPNYLLFLTSFG